MLVVFFTIVFIAEIIVTCWFVSKIKKLRNKVAGINLAVNQISPEIISGITQTRAVAETISTKLGITVNFVEEKKCDCVDALKKGLLTTLMFNITKLPGKKIFTMIDLFLTIRKIVKSFIKK